MINTKMFTNIPMRRLLRWSIGFLIVLTLFIYFFESRSVFSYQVYEVKGGYAYQIEKAGKVFIVQDFVPTLQNYQPFKSKEQARKAACLVIKKLKKQKVPALSAVEIQEILR
jgi:hypothetical protein